MHQPVASIQFNPGHFLGKVPYTRRRCPRPIVHWDESKQVIAMESASTRFSELLVSSWLPSFCDARADDFRVEGFDGQTLRNLSEFDAHWFLRAVDSNLVAEEGGFFVSAEINAKSQIFSSGVRGTQVRRVTVSLEPIISVGAGARLVEEFGWPKDRISLRTPFPWPFDFHCLDVTRTALAIACEVKKSRREIDDLVPCVSRYGLSVPLESMPPDGKLRNAYKKVVGIRAAWPSLFWALGPAGYSKVFSVARRESGTAFELHPVHESALQA